MATATDHNLRMQISELFKTSKLSDLTITCGGQKFLVHKVILYIQSEYFRKLFGGPFKEASAETLDLPDDDPYAIRVLIRYFYNNVLNTSLSLPTSHVHYQSDSAFLIQLYAVADKYDVPPLRSLILERLDAICDPLEHETDFIDALRVVDDCTADDVIWEILLPKLKTNLQTLLKNQTFREVVTEQSAMTLQLLDSLAPDPRISSPEKSKARPLADVESPFSKRNKTSGSEGEYKLRGASSTHGLSTDAVRLRLLNSRLSEMGNYHLPVGRSTAGPKGFARPVDRE